MKNEFCSDSPDALISLIEAIKLSYWKPPDKPRKRGRENTFSELSFLLLAVVAVVTKTFSDSALHRLLSEDWQLSIACEFSRIPHRSSILRRLKALLPSAEEQISRCGKRILQEIEIGEQCCQLSAIDGRMYQAVGRLWHKKHRLQRVIPAGLRNVDTESSWSKSASRGWVQGYRLVLQTLVFPEPVPLFAIWRENSRNEAEVVLPELESGKLPITEVMLGRHTLQRFRIAAQICRSKRLSAYGG